MPADGGEPSGEELWVRATPDAGLPRGRIVEMRYAAGLSASTFLRPQQIIAYDRAALADVQEGIVALATAEALPAHGEAVVARFAQDGAR